MSRYGVFSGPYFLAFGLNTERYEDAKGLSIFSPNTGKHGPEQTPYLDTFHAVSITAQKMDFFNKCDQISSFLLRVD